MRSKSRNRDAPFETNSRPSSPMLPIPLDRVDFKDRDELFEIINKVNIDLELEHMLDAFNINEAPQARFYTQLMIS